MGISRLTFLVIAMLGFALLSQQVVTHTTEGVDIAILQQIPFIQTPLLNRWFQWVTALGNPDFLLILNLLFCLYLLIQNQWKKSLFFAIMGSAGVEFNFFLKAIFSRERPELWGPIIEVKHMSYPSGHAMDSILIYGLICYYLMTQFKPWRSTILTLTSILVLVIGMSRLYLGVHWPTDILAGYLAGFVWLMISILSLETIEALLNPDKKLENE